MERCVMCHAEVHTAERGTAFGGRGRRRKTCSGKCRTAWHRLTPREQSQKLDALEKAFFKHGRML